MRCGTTPGVEITPATIRTESWLAIAGGAHGLAFFPPDWDVDAAPAIGSVVEQIRRLEPALLQPVEAVQVEAAPGVRASARSYHGAVYVIAVNAGTSTTNVRLTVPGLGDRILSELDGARTFQARGGTFSDRLGPLRTRIYVAAPVG